MVNKKTVALTAIIVLFFVTPLFSMEKVFYTLRNYSKDPATLKDIEQHHQKIDVIIAQAYYVLKNGRVKGRIGQGDQSLAEKYHLKFMPMVTNEDYDAKAVSAFLGDQKAQQRTITTLLNYCKKYKVYGLQIDFEHIPETKKNQFNRFYGQLSTALHRTGLALSVAVIPNPYPSSRSAYQQSRRRTWSGVFDLKYLAQKSDFVSVMAYDQHVNTTTPGPIAGIPWDKKVLDSVLTFIPKNKLSFGIPSYSGRWSVQRYPICNGKKALNISLQNQLTYSQAFQRMKHNHATLLWDSAAKVNYTFYPVDGLYQYLFFENKKSFQYKIALVKDNQLRGISVFSLGQEDPAIWSVLTPSSK